MTLPFIVIYLHNVRGFSLGTAGLVVATTNAVGIVTGPVGGTAVDRIGSRSTLALSLVVLGAGYGAFPLIREPWQAFLLGVTAGAGNGSFYPARATLIGQLTPAPLRPASYAVQRVTVNVGVGIGGLVGGLLANVADPGTFTVLFLLDAASFIGFALALRLVREPARTWDETKPTGRYSDVLRDRAFRGLLLLNSVFVAAAYGPLAVLPAFAKNTIGVSEKAIGLIFFVNAVSVVVVQLPVVRMLGGHRRTRALALMGALWALAWVIAASTGSWLSAAAATVLLSFAMVVFAVGESIHAAVLSPLTVDLASPRLLGRYMALSAVSWQLGLAAGPAAAGYGLALLPHGTWLLAGGVCAAAAIGSLALERSVPAGGSRTGDQTEVAPETGRP
jgi:MFS family permease